MFHISPGDTLLLLADTERGIALQKMSFFSKLADAVFIRNREDADIHEDEMRFAQAICETEQCQPLEVDNDVCD